MSTIVFSNQSSVVLYTYQQTTSHIASLRLRHAETKNNPEGKVPSPDTEVHPGCLRCIGRIQGEYPIPRRRNLS